MTQNWTDDVFASSHNAQTDLQNMENNFQTLKSLFEGTSAPANTVAGMPWFDSGKDLLRLRNAANASWYGVMHADASQQIWVYRNDAMSGWLVVTSVVDKVLAIKGGSNAYNLTGGTTAGTWQQPGHALSVSEIPSHSHNMGNSGGHRHIPQYYWAPSSTSNAVDAAQTTYGVGGSYDGLDISWRTASSSYYRSTYDGDHSHTGYSTGGNGSHNHGSTYRPAAAVGTLQRMDV